MFDVATEHIPVMLEESILYLNVRQGGCYVDCTLGMGGHSERILSLLAGKGQVLALDRDQEALQATEKSLSESGNISYYHENFKNLPLILRNLGIDQIDGCLVDLGVSRHQLTDAERGFSFHSDGPLDMRMDREQPTTAAQLVNQLSRDELAGIFKRYGEEVHAQRLASAIVQERQRARFRSTRQLADLIVRIKPKSRGSRTHPATQVFQALRIEVNQELESLDGFVSAVIGYLRPGGRLVMISFHSLEDRIVKKAFQLEAGRCICFRPGMACTCPRVQRVNILTRKPLIPSQAEIERNPSSRSAKLRAAERIVVEQE